MLLNKRQIEWREEQIKFLESITDGLQERNQKVIERYRDEILLTKAMLSINIGHCDAVGIDVVELTKAIKRRTY